ncbi:34372_t:CDS:2, partial [Racocetra persica]
ERVEVGRAGVGKADGDGCDKVEELLQIREGVLKVDLEGCSLVKAVDKGNWKSTKRVKIYGLIVDMEKGVVEVPEEKIERVQEELKTVERLQM